MRFRLTQQRPNVNVDFFETDADGKSIIQEFINQNKITSDGLTVSFSENQLVKTNTMEFTSDESYNEFKNNMTIHANTLRRRTYCDENSISWSLEVI